MINQFMIDRQYLITGNEFQEECTDTNFEGQTCEDEEVTDLYELGNELLMTERRLSNKEKQHMVML